MRFVTYEHGGNRFVGALVGDDAVKNLTAASAASGRGDPAWFTGMQALIETGDAGIDEARRLMERDGHVVPLADVRLLAPLPRPQSIRDFFTFPDHIRQSYAGMQRLGARLAGMPAPTVPPLTELPALYLEKAIYHKGNPLTVVGPDTEILWPRYSKFMDFELELAIIIGRPGADIKAERAAAHIFGYTIFNDFSARDAQMAEMPGMMGPAKGKDFDRSNAIGPCIATPDEFADVHDIRMRASVNGELWAEGSNSAMLHRFEDIIAYVSRDETLHPGELLGSGTMGNGCGVEHDRFLEDGDEVALAIDGIGVLTNRVRRQD
ncbi:FAA hydrolase [Sphingobium indicum IP26]|uniref:Fumarylacetoacetate hydrolase n=1 Tax=Sphingobium indicum F2 TaxID=1450518 RepID=A0A8E0WRC5_9SPHN|nr:MULTISPECIES: fumarylacetoacetate hydrolase family protein [Sphingobium]EPR15247.1 FAA hydrolase [Sphingobium indicum IP26]EQB03017.1 FAA hydrolase [Sphingobium sp. HDIP04]KER34915.1 fumarylacetoacetate hydrolase [Sphingobium indicum F2]KER35518.1 fumarylacetoacetate hydrolase [Sphingobium indicum F2]